VVPRGPGLTPRIEVVAPDDALPERGLKAKTPLLLALMAVLIAVGVLVLFTSRKPSVTQEPLPAAPAALEQGSPPSRPAAVPEKPAEPLPPREPAVAPPTEKAPEVTAPAPVPKAAPRVVRRQASPPVRSPRKQQPAAKRPAPATTAPATKPKTGVIVRESPF
jgi:cytoskeletal protein RodZ